MESELTSTFTPRYPVPKEHYRSNSSQQARPRQHDDGPRSSSADNVCSDYEEDDGEENKSVVEYSEAQVTETSLLLAGAKSMYGSSARTGLRDLAHVHKTFHRRSLSFGETVNPITLTWANLNLYAPVKARGFCGRTYKTEEYRQILNNVSGIARPGNLMAVMGPSGSGKSVLLSALTGRSIGDVVMEGDVKLNGQRITKSIKALSGYIRQEELYYGAMKVQEHLWFQAQLRMDAHIPMQDRWMRVQEVMTEMGLNKCANTPIGIPGSRKGISGGEMKRLSFASEILTNPPLLVCDEPTSGLDAFMAENVINVLKSMAKKGKTIVISIHQPSSKVFNLFDDLILMTESKVAYFGPSINALDFFRFAGFPCPAAYNPADHYINHLAIQPECEEESRRIQTHIVEKYKETSECRQLSAAIQYIEEHSDVELAKAAEQHEMQNQSPYKSSWFRQMRALIWRSWIAQTRDLNVSVTRILQSLLVAGLMSLVFFQQQLNERGVLNINGAFSLITTNLSFANCIMVIASFPRELPIFFREHNNGMYRVDAYFIAKNIAEFLTFLLVPTIFVMINYWMIGLRPGWEALFFCWLSAFLICNTAVSFGYFLSAALGRVDLCLTVCTPVFGAATFLNGFHLNLSTLPPWLSWVQYVFWFRYSYEMFLVNQWHENNELSCSYSLNISNHGAPCFQQGDDVLNFVGLSASNLVLDIGALVGIMVTLRFAAYVALWLKAKH